MMESIDDLFSWGNNTKKPLVGQILETVLDRYDGDGVAFIFKINDATCVCVLNSNSPTSLYDRRIIDSASVTFGSLYYFLIDMRRLYDEENWSLIYSKYEEVHDYRSSIFYALERCRDYLRGNGFYKRIYIQRLKDDGFWIEPRRRNASRSS